MIKKYIVITAFLMTLMIFTSTSNASLLSLKEIIYQKTEGKTAFELLVEKISQISFYKNDDISIDTDDELLDTDDLKEDMLLPKIVNIIGEITPDDGDEIVTQGNDTGRIPTIDINGLEGANLNNNSTVDKNMANEIINEITIDSSGENGTTLSRVIEIVTGLNVKFGETLQRVVEHTYAPGTTKSDGVAENIVDTVVVVGGNIGTAETITAEHVVVTSND